MPSEGSEKARGKKKIKEDPEEILKRKFKAKCLFRALYRRVLANAYWLIEDIDQYEGDDVKRRVQQAVRGKAKAKKQLLSITDKALLNKPAYERTDHEKKYIYRIIGGLKCFKKYPNHVKKKLAAVTYFRYYGPGRVIVRQHHEAHALYFIVNGDIAVSQTIYDELLQQYVSIEIGVMHHGDMFGEVSLLHNIPRTATCTTVGHCEVLALMKEDFKNVLLASVQKQWDEVNHAMSAFSYFDALDDVARREGCIVAKMKSYEPDETLLGDGVGLPNFVYFLLSGRCQMIETLQIKVVTTLGKTFYSLYDPYVPKEESEQDFEKYFDAYKNLNQSKETAANSSTSSPSIIIKPGNQKERKTVLNSRTKTESILKLESSKNQLTDSTATGKEETHGTDRRESVAGTIRSERGSLKSQVVIMSPTGSQTHRESVRLSVVAESDPAQISKKIPVGPEKPKSLRTYFMQVCQFSPGASFGFGENMRDRRIVALSKVDCLLLPMVWLLQRNTANIWTRIQHYLEKKIPIKKELFKQFVQERRWEEYREGLVEDTVAASNTVNWTSLHDVPYSIRLEEMHDI